MKNFLIFFLIIISIKWLNAEPMFITFKEMVKKSKNIVVGHITEYPKDGDWYLPGCKLEVTEILKGDDLKIGNHSFSRSASSIYTKVGEEFIAFIDSINSLTWIATCDSGKNIKESLLFVEGLYDYNAYLVHPSQITYPLLKDYLKNGTYTINYKGNLNFYDSKKKEIYQSSIYFESVYTYPSEETKSKTNLTTSDFTSNPNFSSSAWEQTATITYESNLIRPLKFLGVFEDIDVANNLVKMDFYTEEPFFYKEVDFKKYINDPKLGSPFYSLDVIKENKVIFSIPIGYTHTDEKGFREQMSKYFDYNEFSFREDQYITGSFNGKECRIEYNSTDIPIPVPELGFDEEVIQSLLISPWKGKLKEHNIKNYNTITLKLGETFFLINPNYKQD